MEAIFHRDFKKQYRKLDKNIQKKFDLTLSLFMENPFNPALKNHLLHGKYGGLKSINITGDIRAIYEIIANNIAHFLYIGTHSELYE